MTKEIYHGNFFSKMTSKRMEFGGKDGPGPGDYEAYKQPQTVLEHAHIRNPEKTQFESNVPRYNDQIVHDAERMVSDNEDHTQMFMFLDIVMPCSSWVFST